VIPTGNTLQQSLDAAIGRLLRPLVRLLLRHAMPYARFEALAKRAYVESAMRDFVIAGKRPSVSRASILTGLTRKDVQQLLVQPDIGQDVGDSGHNRAARVLTAWLRDSTFRAADGQPRDLAMNGDDGFAALVKRYSGDMPARAVLDELVRVGAVRRRDDGHIQLLARGYVPQASEADKLDILGTDVADLIDTIDHNLQHGAADPFFQRKVMYLRMPADAVPAFRKLAARQGQALLERMDAWLCARDDAAPDDASTPGVRIGLGIYYFEERLEADTSTKGPV